jgi:hypothetical protein
MWLSFTNLVPTENDTNPLATVTWRYTDGTTNSDTRPTFGIGFEEAFEIVPDGTGSSAIVAFYFAISDLDPASHWVVTLHSSVGATPGATAGLVFTARSATAFAVRSPPEINSLQETLMERQSALSGLITYVGSDLQNGGQIAGARLGMGLSPLAAPGGDVFNYLASLPFYSDDFPLKNGVYAWWLPDSIQEHFYKPYRQPRVDLLETDSILHFAMTRDNPNQDVRLKSIHAVEVITRSRLYSSKPGPTNPSYELMISAAKHVPAVTINSWHTGILGRAWGAIKKWVSHPTNWVKLLKTGGDAVSLISPEIGSKIGEGAKVLQRIVG